MSQDADATCASSYLQIIPCHHRIEGAAVLFSVHIYQINSHASNNPFISSEASCRHSYPDHFTFFYAVDKGVISTFRATLGKLGHKIVLLIQALHQERMRLVLA